MLGLSNICHCAQYSSKLTNRHFCSSKNAKIATFTMLKYVLWKWCRNYLSKWWMLELSNLCHCVLHPRKLTEIGISGSVSRKVSHSICKHMFCENAVGYLRNGECKSFQTFAIVFSTSENWLVRHFWRSKNERKPLSMQKMCSEKMLRDISEKVNATGFKHLPLYSAPLTTD